jgi:hypothetical protein
MVRDANQCNSETPVSPQEIVVGDTAYAAAPMLNWLVEEKGIN